MIQAPIYLDYAATTPVSEDVAELMSKCLTLSGNFGNPASRSHLYGWKAEEAVENARSQIAELINADTREIVWTSGATESNNLAIKGLVKAALKNGAAHVITSLTEHKAVLDTCEALESLGVEVSYIAAETSGLVSAEKIKAAIRPETCLVSIMHVNNETGAINDIAEIGRICRASNVYFHVDAAQSACRLSLDTKKLDVDFVSISAHKMYGPKGVGALFVRRSSDLKLLAEIHGGGHERGMRSGTLPTHQIAGFGLAAHLAAQQREDDNKKLVALKQRFLDGLSDVECMTVNGDPSSCVPGILNLSFDYVDGEALLLSLSGLAISTGSACTSASLEPSYVLKAMGVSDRLAHSALRFSFGRYTTESDIDTAVEMLVKAVTSLRESSAEWNARNSEGVQS